VKIDILPTWAYIGHGHCSQPAEKDTMTANLSRILHHNFKLFLVMVGVAVGLGHPETAEARSATGYRYGADVLRTQARRSKSKLTRSVASRQGERSNRRFAGGHHRSKRSMVYLGRHRGISNRVWSHLGPRFQNIVRYLGSSGKKGPATFDADGTLWAGDVGEGFFGWMLKNRAYPAHRIPKLQRAWQGYKAGTFNGEKMYELMVTGMAGMKETDVQKLASQYFRGVHRYRLYRPMAYLVSALKTLDIQPWVVSGSPYWVVAAGARQLGIPKERVIGLKVKVDAQGRLTDEVVRPVPWKSGKAKRIIRDVGQTPVLAAGNSYGDIQMLRIASEFPLVVNPGPTVLKHAQSNGWPIHRYSRNDEITQRMMLPPPRPRGLLPGPVLPVGLLPAPSANR
jgi:phosphoserine phosphatase